jgi:hypothetical protein
MDINNIIKRLAELLYKDEGVYDGAIYFDWSSYDYEDEIPTITINDKELKVEEFVVSPDGNTIVITTDEGMYTFNVNDYTEEDFHNMGIYLLLNSVYYETYYSDDLGDFETYFS